MGSLDEGDEGRQCRGEMDGESTVCLLEGHSFHGRHQARPCQVQCDQRTRLECSNLCTGTHSVSLEILSTTTIIARFSSVYLISFDRIGTKNRSKGITGQIWPGNATTGKEFVASVSFRQCVCTFANKRFWCTGIGFMWRDLRGL